MPSGQLSDAGKALQESNGLKLCLRPLREGIIAEEWQQEWARLKSDPEIGELSPIEEALVSPVLTMTTVLQLPSGQQLGYRGSVINFLSETSSVAWQLPRAPSDCKIIVYRQRGKAGTHRDVHVRRRAVEEHLIFFSKYHYFFQHGIPDPHRRGQYIVPPLPYDRMLFWLNEDVLKSLPEDGEPDGIEICYYKAEEVADEPPNAKCCDGNAAPREISEGVLVNSKTLLNWIELGAGTVAQAVRLKLVSAYSLDVVHPDDANHILNILHGRKPGDPSLPLRYPSATPLLPTSLPPCYLLATLLLPPCYPLATS